jgi:arabinose-5-phosphate isomerase
LANTRYTNLATLTLRIESDAIQNLISLLPDNLDEIIEKIYHCKGRFIIAGIGKSAIVGQKIVASLNSTGTPSTFLHAAAIHGDLGMIQKEDIVMIISKSGNTEEIKVLSNLVKNFGNPIIAMVGNLESHLAKQATYILNTYVEKEACPNNLAPTTSTTAQMAMGDVLTTCLVEKRGFSDQDFAKFHPGGALGKKLYLKVQDVLDKHKKPSVVENDPIQKVLDVISTNRLGATVVLNSSQEMVGIITDGDLRRVWQKGEIDLNQLKAKDLMSINPKSIQHDELAIHAFQIMNSMKINQLVVQHGQAYAGIIHIHDLIKEGIN